MLRFKAGMLQGGDHLLIPEQRRLTRAGLDQPGTGLHEPGRGLAVDAGVKARLAGHHLLKRFQDQTGEPVGGIVSLAVHPTQGDPLPDGVPADIAVDPLRVERDRLTAFQAEAGEQLPDPLRGQAARLEIFEIKMVQEAVQPAEGDPLFEILQVQSDMDQPGRLQPLLEGPRRPVGNPAADRRRLQQLAGALRALPGCQPLRLHGQVQGHLADPPDDQAQSLVKSLLIRAQPFTGQLPFGLPVDLAEPLFNHQLVIGHQVRDPRLLGDEIFLRPKDIQKVTEPARMEQRFGPDAAEEMAQPQGEQLIPLGLAQL